MYKKYYYPHTLNKKKVINNNNVTSYENIIVTTPYKQEYMLRNYVDNDNMVDKCETITSKPHSKIKNKPTYSNNLDNQKLNLGFKLQKDMHVLQNNNNFTLKNNIDNNNVLQHNTCTTKIKVTHKIGKSHNVKDCRKLEKKRNRNEKNKNATMNDDNNDNVEIKVSSESI